MMLLSALTLAQAAVAAPSPLAAGEEGDPIVVIGERLRSVGVAIRVNAFTGDMRCRVRKSSGDDRLDAAACEISLRCARQERRNRPRTRACVHAGYDAYLDDYFSGEANDNAAN